MRTRAIPQGRDLSSFASPNLPGASCSTPSPSTPRLFARLQPVSLRFPAEAASGDDEVDGGSEGVRDRKQGRREEGRKGSRGGRRRG